MYHKNKKVLIFGLGLNDGGVGMVKYYAQQNTQIRVTDMRTEEQLAKAIDELKPFTQKYNIEYILGEHKEEDFKWADIIVRNPAIKRDNPFLEIARKNGAEIIMEMALFHRKAKGIKLGVTGTRGKSTTTSLIHTIIETGIQNKQKLLFNSKVYDNTLLAGNIGKNAIIELPNITDKTISVLELSSFQLDGMREQEISPQIAVVTNIYPDHLNWHPDMDDYIECKKQVFLNQGPNDIAIINIDNETTIKFPKETKGICNIYSLNKKNIEKFIKENPQIKIINYYYYCQNLNTIYENNVKLFQTSRITNVSLEGEHNKYNILSSVATARSIGIDIETIKQAIKNYKGLYGRQQFVVSKNGIDFYNDTSATTAEALHMAIKRFGQKYSADGNKRVIFISGGIYKGTDYSPLMQDISKYVKAFILFDGDAGEVLEKTMKNAEILTPTYGYYKTMKDAIQKATQIAKKGDAIILSPAGASFNMFLNEWDRGEQFDKMVKLI
ncbi:MAG TPA: UDP-N-acetylmuramoyl-L-alanine--D-glutamate ligase [Candidatus Dojkabacteria bacterium]|nr:UDP-N-acetylmuramoyl-L-alanine--D-glutamate ligase [Candidatus Dojkabacteria bacterium]